MVLPTPTVTNAPSHQRTVSARSHVLGLYEDQLRSADHRRPLSFQLRLDDYAGPDSPPRSDEPLAALPDSPLLAPSSPSDAGPFADAENFDQSGVAPASELARAFIRRRPSAGSTQAIAPTLLTPGIGDTFNVPTFWSGYESMPLTHIVTSFTGRGAPPPPPTSGSTGEKQPNAVAATKDAKLPSSLSAALAAVDLTERAVPTADVRQAGSILRSPNRPSTSSPAVTRPLESLMDRVLNARPAVVESESEAESEADSASAKSTYAAAPDDNSAPASATVPIAVRPRPARVRFLSQPQVLGPPSSKPSEQPGTGGAFDPVFAPAPAPAAVSVLAPAPVFAPAPAFTPAPMGPRSANDVVGATQIAHQALGLGIWWPTGAPRGYPQEADLTADHANGPVYPVGAPTQVMPAFFPQTSPVTRAITPHNAYAGQDLSVQPPTAAFPRAHDAAAQVLQPALAPRERPCLGPWCRPATSPTPLGWPPSAASTATSQPGGYFAWPPLADAVAAAAPGQSATPSPRRLVTQRVPETPPSQYVDAAFYAHAPSTPAQYPAQTRQQFAPYPPQQFAQPSYPQLPQLSPAIEPYGAMTNATHASFGTGSASTLDGPATPPAAFAPQMYLHVPSSSTRCPSPRSPGSPAPPASPGKRRRSATPSDPPPQGAISATPEGYRVGTPELSPSPKRVRPTPPTTPSAAAEQRLTPKDDATPIARPKRDRRPRAGGNLSKAVDASLPATNPQAAGAASEADVVVGSRFAAHVPSLEARAQRASLALLPWRALADGGAAARVPTGTLQQVRRAARYASSDGVAAGLEFRQTACCETICVLHEATSLNQWLQDVGLPAVLATPARQEDVRTFALLRLVAQSDPTTVAPT